MKNGKRFCVCLLAGLLCGGCLVFTGCKDFPLETDFKDFEIYRYLEFDDSVSIVDLTKEGMQKTILDIPAYINGKPVKDLCYKGLYREYILKSENIKTVYLPHTLYGLYELSKLKNVEIFYAPFSNGETINAYHSDLPNFITTIFVPANFYDSILEYLQKHQKWLISLMQAAPVTYMLNNLEYKYTKNECYRVDSAAEGELLKAPPTPYMDGYTFTGWFWEPECRTQWLFDQDIFENEPVVLYAGWRKNE